MGIISVIGNAYPNVITDICNSTNLGESVKIFFEYEPIIKDFENEQSPTGIKYLMSLKGIISDKVRLPLGVCLKTLKRKIEEDYQNLLIKYQK
jgi:dihydrodipicolinate synthase/N-acetylneuraminate lyase